MWSYGCTELNSLQLFCSFWLNTSSIQWFLLGKFLAKFSYLDLNSCWQLNWSEQGQLLIKVMFESVGRLRLTMKNYRIESFGLLNSAFWDCFPHFSCNRAYPLKSTCLTACRQLDSFLNILFLVPVLCSPLSAVNVKVFSVLKIWFSEKHPNMNKHT